MDPGKKQNRWRRLLRSAANYLEKKGWHKGFRYGRKVGDSVKVLSWDCMMEADSFCAIGALSRADGSTRESKAFFKAERHLCDAINNSVAGWNDSIERTREEVIAKLREVANS